MTTNKRPLAWHGIEGAKDRIWRAIIQFQPTAFTPTQQVLGHAHVPRMSEEGGRR